MSCRRSERAPPHMYKTLNYNSVTRLHRSVCPCLSAWSVLLAIYIVCGSVYVENILIFLVAVFWSRSFRSHTVLLCICFDDRFRLQVRTKKLWCACLWRWAKAEGRRNDGKNDLYVYVESDAKNRWQPPETDGGDNGRDGIDGNITTILIRNRCEEQREKHCVESNLMEFQAQPTTTTTTIVEMDFFICLAIISRKKAQLV